MPAKSGPHGCVSRAQRSMSEANGALQTRDPGCFESPKKETGVPDQRCTATLRFALHRVRDTCLARRSILIFSRMLESPQ